MKLVELADGDLAASTKRSYNIVWKRFSSMCSTLECDPYMIVEDEIARDVLLAEYIRGRAAEGMKVKTITSEVSALRRVVEDQKKLSDRENFARCCQSRRAKQACEVRAEFDSGLQVLASSRESSEGVRRNEPRRASQRFWGLLRAGPLTEPSAGVPLHHGWIWTTLETEFY